MNQDFVKFLRKLVKFAVLSCAAVLLPIIFGVFVIGCQYEEYYQASIIGKIARLRAINEPKIILVGNSNLVFGMDSRKLQEAMNMPVVNLGLHGGLGNAFHENMAKLNINSGDIVIVCHSDYSDDDSIIDVPLAWITLEYHFDLWGILRPKDYPKFMRMFPKYWIGGLVKMLQEYFFPERYKLAKGADYSRERFNEYGDVIRDSSISLSEQTYTSGSVSLPGINDICINRLNELNAFVKRKNAVMLVAGYPICFGKYTPPAEKYIEFQEELASKLDCEVISDYTDYFFPPEYFYDSILHLNIDGVRLRTEQLIKDLCAWKSRHSDIHAN